MATVNVLQPEASNSFHYIIVGGGTAGCVIASRLSEYLPNSRILLIEGGDTDQHDERISNLRRCLELIGGELDYDYGVTEQMRGNSFIRHSRAKILGGCSSHNGGISVETFEYDCRRFETLGCKGWSYATFKRLLGKLLLKRQPCHEIHHNALVNDWIKAASTSLGIPAVEDFNKALDAQKNMSTGVGYVPIAYEHESGKRNSASTAYIHPILQGEWKRPNLTILLNTWVSKINVSGNTVNGVNVTFQNGNKMSLQARKETILCAGAIDTPRLMLLSGLGPREHLNAVGIPVTKDLPGVGENLQDHIETMITWELKRPAPEETAMYSDAVLFLRREVENARGLDKRVADLMFHIFTCNYDANPDRRSNEAPPTNVFSMTPNVPRPMSRGRLYLTSSDPNVQPALDFRYFTDPEGYDEATLVAGIKIARKVAQQAPFKDWIQREIAPGPSVITDKDLSAYGRQASCTIYHPTCTTKMGDVERDPFAVVDPQLKIRGLRKVRIADAGVLPVITTANPMLTVLAIGERAAEMIAEEAGYKKSEWTDSDSLENAVRAAGRIRTVANLQVQSSKL
ncbi:unnamed protein product, partial [Clonostachys byssicola]